MLRRSTSIFQRLITLSKGERSFVKNVLTFMGGRSFAVAITFLLIPVLARLYTPEHWGLAALFLGICMAVGPVSSLSYERAIPIAKEHAEALELLRLCILLTLVFSLLVVLVGLVLFAADRMPQSFRELSFWLWLVPVGIALDSGVTALEYWLLRHKRYKSLGGGEVTQALGRSGIRLGTAALFGSTLAGLIGSILIAYVAKLGILLRACKDTFSLHGQRMNLVSLFMLASRYRDFATYNAPTGLVMQVTKQLPIFVLASFFGPEAVGFFGMADRLVRTPIHVAANTIRQVFLQKIADTSKAGRSIRPALSKAVAVLAGVAILPFLVLWLFGQDLVVLFLGARWEAAGRFLEIMAPYLLTEWLGGPFQSAAIVLRRQRLWSGLQFLAAGARWTILPVAVFTPATPELIVSVYVWTTVISHAIVMVVIFRCVPRTGSPLSA